MISIIKSFVARLSFISVLNVILVAYARPENTFLSDPSGPLLLLDDPLNDANSDNNHLLWDSDEIAFNIPDLADIATTSGNTDTFIDTSNGLFTTNSLDPLILASACDTQGSLSDDFLQARDEGSCAGRDKPAEAVNLPKLFDEDFLLQGLGAQLIRPSEEPNQGSGSEKSDAGWAAFGEAIPVDLQLQEDLQLCPGDLFLTSTTPVCENPVTGGVVYEFGQLHATLLNVIPYTLVCPLNYIWCCSIIYARDPKPGERGNPSLSYTDAQLEILSRLHPTVSYDGIYCHPMAATKEIGMPVSLN